jgi:hypothetical protein
MIELVILFFTMGAFGFLLFLGMADQALTAVSNSVFISKPTGGVVFIDASTGSNTDIKAGLIVKMNSATRVVTLAQNNADPNSADDPFAVVLPREDTDIATAFAANIAVQVVPLRSGATVWVLASGAEDNSDTGWTRGSKACLSIQDAGMVMMARDFATALESTPTATVAATAIQKLQNQIKGYIGTCTETHAGHATEDRWIKVKLD